MLSDFYSAVPLSDRLIYCGDDDGRLFTLDPGNGSVSLIGTMPAAMDDIAFNLQGELYGVSASGSGSNVYRIDPTTAAGNYVGHAASFVNALAFRDDGTLFAARHSLFTINTQTGASTVIGDLGSYSSAGDLAFDTAGNLYLATTNNSLVRVNPSTGATTLVGAIGFSEIWGLAFGRDGVLRGVSNHSEELIQINVLTGAGTLIAGFAGHGTTGAFGADRWRGSLPQLSINNVTLTEGNSGTKTFTFTVSITGANPYGASVDYATANGSATTADNDYAARTGTLTWVAGDMSAKTIDVAVNGDLKLEPDETFFVNLSNPTSAAIADGQGLGTIRDADGIIYACDSGGRLFTLDPQHGNVSLIGTMPAVMTDIAFNLQGELFGVSGTSVSGSNLHRINPSTAAATSVGHVGPFVNALTFRNDGTLFAAGDSLVTINTATGAGTLVGGLTGGYHSAGDLAFDSAGNLFLTTTNNALVKVNPSTGATTLVGAVGFSQIWGLAFGPDGVLRGVSNQSEELIQIDLATGQGAHIASFGGHGTTGALGADTWPGLLPQLSISDVTMTEGDSGTRTFGFTVSMTGPNPTGVSVHYATADGSATAADNDYEANSGTLTWAPGDTSPKPVSITVNGDMVLEADELFYVNLSAPTDATLADAQGVGGVTNDDGPPRLAVNNIAVREGLPPGTSFTRFTVRLSAPSGQTIRVNYATHDGTATANRDYAPRSGQLVFAPHQIEQIIPVTVKNDAFYEANETFSVWLTGAVNAVIADGLGTCTIKNDDPKPAVAISGATKREGNAGTTRFDFLVALSAVSGRDTRVRYSTKNGTAAAASDFTAVSGTLTIPAGRKTARISVWVNGDKTFERDETFQMVLANPDGAAIAKGKGSAAGRIVNDDKPRRKVATSGVVQGLAVSSAAAPDTTENNGKKAAAVAAIMEQWTSADNLEDRCTILAETAGR